MKPKGDKAVTSAETLMTFNVPGAFDGFLEGTGEVQGDSGDTPFRLSYNAAERTTRGRGYSLRLKFPVTDADEIVSVLSAYAETCIECNGDQMEEPGVPAQVKAARTVLTRCDELAAKLKAARDVPETTWRAEPRGNGFVVTNGTEFLTRMGTSDPHVYGTKEQAEWFARGATERAKDRELQPTYWLTLLDSKVIRWFSTVSPACRAVVSIVDPESTKHARLIDHDNVEEPGHAVRLHGKPLGYTKFGRYTALNFKRFTEQHPQYAHLVQGISEGRGVTYPVLLNADGNDTEGLWK